MINNEEKKVVGSTFNEEEKRKYYDRIARRDALLGYMGYYIYEENSHKWIDNVSNNLDRLDATGKIISGLGRGEDFSVLTNYLNGLSDEEIDFTLKNVLQFSKRGPEFFRATCDLTQNKKAEKTVRKIEKRNAKWQRNEERKKEAKTF